MRNADLSIEEDEAEDLLKEIEKQIKKRQWGQAIRLEVEAGIDKRLLKILKEELAVEEEDIYRIDGPLDLTVLMKIYGLDGYEHLKVSKHVPQPVPEISEGISITLGRTLGTCTVANSNSCFSFLRLLTKAPIFRVLLRIRGNGLEESTAIGVKTG